MRLITLAEKSIKDASLHQHLSFLKNLTMVANVNSFKVMDKTDNKLTIRKALVADGMFKTKHDLAMVNVNVELAGEGNYFSKITSSMVVGGKGDTVPYINLEFHNIDLTRSLITTDKYGKKKFSLKLNDKACESVRNLGKHMYKLLSTFVEDLSERTLVYTSRDGEQSWIYVDYNDKDKFLAPTLNNQEELTVEKFNEIVKGLDNDYEKYRVIVGLYPFVWQTAESFEYTLKFRLMGLNVQQ